MGATDLSRRSGRHELPTLSPGGPEIVLLTAEACRGAWRIVEALSEDARPFTLLLQWGAGEGSGANARISVSRACRVCVYARSLVVKATNLYGDGSNTVGVTVADGYADTRNTFETTDQLAGTSTEVEYPIPPFAYRVHLEMVSAVALAGTSLRIYDGTNVLRSHTEGDAQGEGVLLGGARRLVLISSVGGNMRLVYELQL